MDELFLIFFLVSFLVMVIGLIKPDLYKTLPESKRNRKSIAIYFGGAAIVFFILFELVSSPVEEDSMDFGVEEEQVVMNEKGIDYSIEK